ncbi:MULTISPECIES: radical SAM family heme chaperone HemW [unclassified Meiothermus]|uniref:radical SAM family heme chaperone HemW n=1 Tax=unclassified Meiothermus TaxID=370471 RepID=UPI000D7CABA3|nr:MULTISPECIES: radical SAM family heme chaperone HemW [unclassified Meiothermus]PZA07009.1 coproporphyrinogen III oxidase family protein [Meiothermus sp. Pnk-1]RYM35289.1 radical SAM family heme chaperone HemW [Meiothermus sp. PNK-Is4]
MRSLYVHVPFCPTLCPYCDFHVVRRQGGIVEAYLERLAEEAAALYERFPSPLDTLYFGGGTPSFLRAHELERLFAALPWRLSPGAEVTMEANPGTLNRERLALLKHLGVNRLSIGVQSFQDGVLKTLGRAHGRRGAFQAVEMSLEVGFRTSIDLILGLPGQDFEADLREAAALGVGHVSAYTLQVEPGTPFAVRGVRLDEDLEAAAFEAAEAILGEAGLLRYEVSNFARPGEESRHNRAYWRNDFWGALGPAAAGHYPKGVEGHEVYSVRATHPPLPRWLAGEAPAVEAIGPLEHARESLMLGLRLCEGVDVGALEGRTALDLWTPLRPAVEQMASEGLLRVQGKRIWAKNLGAIHPLILRLWAALELTKAG